MSAEGKQLRRTARRSFTADRPNGGHHAAQRARLLGAIVDLVSRDGYTHAKVGEITSRAGVSRATFYELFEDKEECLLAAYAREGERFRAGVERLLVEDGSSCGMGLVLGEMVGLAASEPYVFDFLFHEALLAGGRAQDQRDALISDLEATVNSRPSRIPPSPRVVDMSPRPLLEGAVRLLSMRLGRDGQVKLGTRDELFAWVECYAVPRGTSRWPELVTSGRSLRPIRRSHSGAPPLPRSLPKGRHRLSVEAVRAIQRERIAYGTAAAIRAKGYANLTVGDIVANAGVSRDVFYSEFHDKQEAFDGAVKLLFEQLLATMASAFFGSSQPWPERVWSVGEAFVRFLEDHPVLANFLFVGTYAPPPYIVRVNDLVLAFTLFIDDGYRYRPEAGGLPPVLSEALVCAVLETVVFRVRRDETAELRGLTPLVVYMVLAPFMGPEDARRFVEAKIDALPGDAS